MASQHDDEFNPIWPPGLNQVPIEDIYKRCVEDFAKSSTRGPLFEAFKVVIDCATDVAIEGDVWLDGSFVTEKPDPADIDFILVAPTHVYDNGSAEQRAFLDGLVEGDLWKRPFECDTNVAYVDHQKDPLTEYWMDRFGFSVRDRIPKGIVVIRLPIQNQNKDAQEGG